ncbi:glutathione S-transferase family protein [Aspergillus clavatus NRRL 1]|uniref:Glutathione S-transferase, putative n=1 Tax=Aspergillus clavatus (strain ATCC 1007 / CBS 513.65 / DSM 816 / NCTC 3887 / NRRL 1 / QM 1276 / 107) TaxID=344612 RepID=A1CJQ8_ASPCL|nr:glutathione S-transferase, putative [Aspergillus clavatus NRRL 1]EAW09382.1 glutathione S-transferase, putative [Aspergillus clavatus NRRL 1]
MASDTPLHFFDINSTLPGPSKSWSPNTLKTRIALNYKRIPYTQSWVSYPDIAPLLSSLAVPKSPTQTAYTLPAITHDSVTSNPTGTLMDSLAIAHHLEATFPTPPLFPSGDASYALALAVHKLISIAFSTARPLILPPVADFLDPRAQEYFVRTRSAAFGQPLADVRPRDPERVRALTADTLKDLEIVVQMLRGWEGKKSNGPFFEGETAGYADFIVVAFLAWAERADQELWRAILGLGEGELERLWEACLPWVNGQGEEKEWPIPQV